MRTRCLPAAIVKPRLSNAGSLNSVTVVIAWPQSVIQLGLSTSVPACLWLPTPTPVPYVSWPAQPDFLLHCLHNPHIHHASFTRRDPPAENFAHQCVTSNCLRSPLARALLSQANKDSSCAHNSLGSRASSIDESRHGDEVTKEDETVMDSEQGNSTSCTPQTNPTSPSGTY